MENNLKKKVVIVSNIMDKGGAERTVQTIATHIDRNRFDISVLCLEAGGARVEAIKAAGIPVYIGNGTIESIKTLFPNPIIDVLHVHRSGHHEPFHVQVVEYLKPKKLMETNVFAFDDSVLGPKFDLRIYKSMMMLTQRAWNKKTPKEEWWKQQRVIYNPVTFDQFSQYTLTEKEREEKRNIFGFTQDHVVIGRVGRADPVKWGDLVLHALPYIKKQFPNVRVLFRTAPENRKKYIEQHEEYTDIVRILPETSDEKELAETYQLLDVYVHPSRRGEAFGNTLNEAMVWKLPIIAENTPHWDNGQVEQVIHGKTGYLVKSVNGFMAALSELVNNTSKRRNMGMEGYNHVIKDFGIERGVKQYELAYEQLCHLVPMTSVREQVYPSCEMIEGWLSVYPQLAEIDYMGKRFSFKQFRHLVYSYLWRVDDSLRARGIKK